jgi:hypothetical protein
MARANQTNTRGIPRQTVSSVARIQMRKEAMIRNGQKYAQGQRRTGPDGQTAPLERALVQLAQRYDETTDPVQRSMYLRSYQQISFQLARLNNQSVPYENTIQGDDVLTGNNNETFSPSPMIRYAASQQARFRGVPAAYNQVSWGSNVKPADPSQQTYAPQRPPQKYVRNNVLIETVWSLAKGIVDMFRSGGNPQYRQQVSYPTASGPAGNPKGSNWNVFDFYGLYPDPGGAQKKMAANSDQDATEINIRSK